MKLSNDEPIDKNLPHNLSARDKIVYEKHKRDKWINLSDYYKTDHWQFVSKEHKLWVGFKCQWTGEHPTREDPLNSHHRNKNYSCLWKETAVDLFTTLQSVHNHFHGKAANGKKYRLLGGAIMENLEFFSDLSLESFNSILNYSIPKDSFSLSLLGQFMLGREFINTVFGQIIEEAKDLLVTGDFIEKIHAQMVLGNTKRPPGSPKQILYSYIINEIYQEHKRQYEESTNNSR